jgi:hypothetical protein
LPDELRIIETGIPVVYPISRQRLNRNGKGSHLLLVFGQFRQV